MKEVRQEAVRFYTGIGSVKGKDGIFSSEQKLAVRVASGLNPDELDLHESEQRTMRAAAQQRMSFGGDVEMDGAADGQEEVKQSNFGMLQNLTEPHRHLEE